MAGRGGPNKRRRSAPKVKSSLDFLARLNQPDTIRPSDFLLDIVNQRATHLVTKEDGTQEMQPLEVTFEQRTAAAEKLLLHELPKLHSIEAEVTKGNLTYEEALAQLEESSGMKTIDATPERVIENDVQKDTD